MKVLNETLYRRLEELAGQGNVKVESRGRPGTYNPGFDPYSNAGGKKGDTPVLQWGEVYCIDCPACDDTTKRLHFSHLCNGYMKKSGKTLRFSPRLYKCFNEGCQKRGRLEKTVGKLDLPIVDIGDSAREVDGGLPARAGIIFSRRETPDAPCPQIPLLSGKVPDYVRDYLEGERGYSMDELAGRYGCMFCAKGSKWEEPGPGDEKTVKELYEDRILFPVFMGGRMTTWQARRLDREKKMKYLFPRGFPKGSVLYNMDEAKRAGTVVIHEGITDVVRTATGYPAADGGVSAVALLGKDLSDQQLAIMELLWGKWGRAVLALDPGEEANMENLKQRILRSGAFPGGAAVLRLPDGKDPGELPAGWIMDRVNDLKYDNYEDLSPEDFLL